ncbi:MAG: hypothetical protein LUE16_09925 [Lachnospiraceae bacterium]|nr:hypothetical protein [Lachnospiraceae bacterium]
MDKQQLFKGGQSKAASDGRKIKFASFAAVLGVAILLSVPVFVNYCLEGEELYFHLLRIEGLKDGLLSGQFPVRIQPNWLEGRGYPVSLFEGDVFLLIPAFLRMAGLSVQMSYHIFLLLINLATVWIGYVCFRGLFDGQEVRLCKSRGTEDEALTMSLPAGWLQGMIAAMLYACSPYRIYVMYGKADLGELLAMTFLPMVFCGMIRILTVEADEKLYRSVWLMPAVGLCAMFFSHITAFELALLLCALLCLAMGKAAFAKKRLLTYLKIFLATVVGCAWMFIPLLDALLQKPYIRYAGSKAIQSTGAYLLDYFILFAQAGTETDRSVSGMQNAVPAGAGFMVMVLLIIYFWILFTGRYRKERQNSGLWRTALRVTIAGVILLWMSTVSFPWDIIRHNRLIQILTAGLNSPMELVPFVSVCLVFTGIVALNEIQQSEKREVSLWVLAGVVVLAVVSTQYLTNDYLETRLPVYIYNSSDLDTNAILDGVYLPLDESTGGPSYEENLADRLNTAAWYWRLSEAVSTTGWIGMAAYSVTISRKKLQEEEENVEEIGNP